MKPHLSMARNDVKGRLGAVDGDAVQKSAWPSVCQVFLLAAVAAFIAYLPWAYGLKLHRDQLIAELIALALFLLASVTSSTGVKGPPAGAANPLRWKTLRGLLKARSLRLRSMFFGEATLFGVASPPPALMPSQRDGIRTRNAPASPCKPGDAYAVSRGMWPPNSLDRWVLFGLGFSAVCVLASAIPVQSLFSWLRLLGAVAFYFSIRMLACSEQRIRFLMWSILVTGFGYTIYGFLQYYGYLPHEFWYQPHALASRFVNSAHFASFLLFPFLMGLALVLISRNGIVKFGALTMVLAMGWGMILTRARTVWLALLAAMVIFLWLMGRYRVLSRKGFWGLVAGLVVSGASLLSYKGMDLIVGRFREVLDGEKFYSLYYRFDLWRGCLRAMAYRPWGWGLGTFSSIFPQFRTHDDRFWVDYAHNELFQVGVECGIAGLAALAAFAVIYMMKMGRILSGPAAGFQKVVAGAFLVIWISFFMVSQLDFPLRIYSIALLMAGFLALSASFMDIRALNEEGHKTLRNEKPSGLERVARSSIFLGVLAAFFFTAIQLFAANHFARGKTYDENYEWQKSSREFELAVKISPIHRDYLEALGDHFRKRLALSLKQDQKNKWRQLAKASYENAIRLNPFVSSNHYFLALLYEQDHDLERAGAEFKLAIRYDPMNSFYVMEYGYFSIRHKDVAAALSAFERFKGFKMREGENFDICKMVRQCAELTSDYGDLKRIIPDDWWHHHCLGLVLGEKRQWGHAKKELDTSMAQAKKLYSYQDFLSHLGYPIANFYVAHHRLEEALDIYREALLQNRQDVGIQSKVQELSEKIRTERLSR